MIVGRILKGELIRSSLDEVRRLWLFVLDLATSLHAQGRKGGAAT